MKKRYFTILDNLTVVEGAPDNEFFVAILDVNNKEYAVLEDSDPYMDNEFNMGLLNWHQMDEYGRGPFFVYTADDEVLFNVPVDALVENALFVIGIDLRNNKYFNRNKAGWEDIIPIAELPK